ncbi:hypothetical protein [Nocardia sp. NPDC005366]|uniref:hypothetical protein n=1 Tax=Nocardia sp. NPDC005366 TaxID=3156878 RepID=UPI0033B5C3AF
MTEVVVLPGFSGGCCAGGDSVSVDEDLEGADVAGEVPGLGICLGQGVRGDFGVMLGGIEGAMSEPCLQFEQGHGFLGVVELARDGGSGVVAGDVPRTSAVGTPALAQSAGMMVWLT